MTTMNQSKTSTKLILATTGIILCFFTPSIVKFQDVPTLPAVEITSVFEEDTCTPPCWFDLSLGVSTITNVHDVFSSEHGSMLFGADIDNIPSDGRFWFNWRLPYWERDDIALIENYMTFNEGIVTEIGVLMNRPMRLKEALERLGQPAFVLVMADLAVWTILIYPEWGLSIGSYAKLEECMLRSIEDDLIVLDLEYFIPENLEEIFEWLEGAANMLSFEEWKKWLQDDKGIDCSGAISQLDTFYEGSFEDLPTGPKMTLIPSMAPVTR